LRHLPLLFVLSSLLLACGAGQASLSGGGGETLVPLADFLREDIERAPIAPARFDEAKVVIVSFWATWCKPCKGEMPLLNDLYKAYGPQGLEVFAVSIDDAAVAGEVRAYVQANRFAFTVVHDEDGVIAGELNPRVDVPFTIVLSKGRVHKVHRGFTAADYPVLEAEVKALLAGAGS
jgi:thiol-disulfide isomerase/thioredoxin